MEIDILDSLDDLGYDKKLKEDDVSKAIKEGVKNTDFTELVSWLSKELQALCSLEESVNSIKDPEDANSFSLELSSFLKEINCPHKILTEGPASQRLLTDNQRIVLLDFLCAELQAARILSKKNDKRGYMEIEMDETKTAKSLRETLSFLDLDAPKEEIAGEEILKNIEKRMLSSLDPENAPLLSGAEPLLTDTLTESQWSALKALQEEMHNEYYLRRQMLLKRLDVTIQSFKWGEELKKKEDKIMECYLPIRKSLKVEPGVQLSDILAARTSCVIIEKTSSSRVQRRNALNTTYKHMMGNVPDRGGRPGEMYPAKEMPSWKKRSGDPFSDRGRGGGRGSWSKRGNKKFDSGDRGRNRKQAFDAAGSYGN